MEETPADPRITRKVMTIEALPVITELEVAGETEIQLRSRAGAAFKKIRKISRRHAIPTLPALSSSSTFAFGLVKKRQRFARWADTLDGHVISRNHIFQAAHAQPSLIARAE